MSRVNRVIDWGDKIWFDIPGYEGFYQINEDGRIRSFRKIGQQNNEVTNKPQRYINPWKKKHARTGYKAVVTLFNGLKHKHYYVGRLVAQVFMGLDPKDKSKQIIHKNGNNMDCRKENLYIGSVSDRAFNFHNPGVLFFNEDGHDRRTNSKIRSNTSYFLLHKKVH